MDLTNPDTLARELSAFLPNEPLSNELMARALLDAGAWQLERTEHAFDLVETMLGHGLNLACRDGDWTLIRRGLGLMVRVLAKQGKQDAARQVQAFDGRIGMALEVMAGMDGAA